MDTKFWSAFLAFLFVLGIILVKPWLITFSILVTILLSASYLYSKRSLKNIFYKRKWHYRRGFPGESTPFQIEIENRKFLPLSWIKTIDLWPEDIPFKNEEVLRPSFLPRMGYLINYFSLAAREKIKRTYTVQFKNRGEYPIGPLEMVSGDIFGIHQEREKAPVMDQLIVFPEILSLESLNLATENPFGEIKSNKRLFEDQSRPMGVRAYHPEDDFRRIHWPATARSGEMQVKVFEPITEQVMIICLNVQTASQPWLGFQNHLFEHLVKISATLSYQNVKNGYSIGLISNGSLKHSDQPFKVNPSKSPQQLSILLTSLAKITPYIRAPFEKYLTSALPKLPFGASLTLVTALVSEELCETLLRFKRYRSNTTLISLDQASPPSIPGINTIHLPYQEIQKNVV
ncbi:MAG: DUF58 domain-containing protein [Anaerolineaceae bacterium]|nr:DUF58 domain-containing protein [Anaerolineaceae bacterium]